MKFLLPQRNQTGSTPKNRADQGDEREERGEGGGNREGRTEGEDYHKEAAINARPKRATRETRRWAPKNQELD